ncbi:hypothetical protein F5972_07505 [Microbispora cellulosiformans]|uniref:Secreted protein n=1 Tax=Microbispora cellulosiformans TaxID=2614688 RepID=A0A5J5KBB9_9ACTN|nr:hypothetical protein [Microbispora cellulosiformans]KAA9380922.1 hypothetical protein F5972_07505 [Microbispora cellulosiformans]
MRTSRAALLSLVVLSMAALTGPAEATTAPKRPLVELREQGGFAGLDNRVRVYADGCALLSRRTGPVTRRCLTASEWRGLRGALKNLRLGRSEAPPQGADFLAYGLTYQGRRVTRYTVPSSWRPVVERLEKILVKYRPR